jgi:hypothetical protein
MANARDEFQRPTNNCLILRAVIKKTPGLSPPANYTDRATAACRRNSLRAVIFLKIIK